MKTFDPKGVQYYSVRLILIKYTSNQSTIVFKWVFLSIMLYEEKELVAKLFELISIFSMTVPNYFRIYNRCDWIMIILLLSTDQFWNRNSYDLRHVVHLNTRLKNISEFLLIFPKLYYKERNIGAYIGAKPFHNVNEIKESWKTYALVEFKRRNVIKGRTCQNISHKFVRHFLKTVWNWNIWNTGMKHFKIM